jgi:hypothetical protein
MPKRAELHCNYANFPSLINRIRPGAEQHTIIEEFAAAAKSFLTEWAESGPSLRVLNRMSCQTKADVQCNTMAFLKK